VVFCCEIFDWFLWLEETMLIPLLFRKLLRAIGVLAMLQMQASPTFSEEKIVFEKDVAPLLKTHCSKCHGAAKKESGFDVRRRFTLLKGGDSGPGFVVGDPSKSLVIERIEDGDMPPEGEPRLPEDAIAILRKWIKTGASIQEDAEPPLPEGETSENSFDEAARNHWAFQPVRKVTPPDVNDRNWLCSPVDAFVLAKLQERGWKPAQPAGRAVLIRRVTFDLTGLPPTPEEVASFVRDTSPDAYEKVVDRLLESPHYGERWAQHWLDVVRFAESEGFEYDRHLPDAWRFRDYVIGSFNSDKPFNQFVTEQLAGDEIDPENREYQTAAVFHRLGAVRRNAGNPDIALSRNEVLTERTNIIGEAFLGLTIGCARCHNHKLEPITQKDYYRLQAYLAATEEHNVNLATEKVVLAWEQQTESINAQIKKLKSQLDQAEGEQQEKINDRISSLESQLPAQLPTIPGIRNDFENQTEIHVLRRGIWEQKGVRVGPRPLSVLVASSVPELSSDVKRPRTALAEWIVDEKNPLTARVIVNRLWQHHFGAGLVATPNDFGTHGAPPSHPKLLDWLAQALIDHQWRLKPIHRYIVLSNTYRQSSSVSPSNPSQQVDPENRLLWKFNRRRLSGEEIRDAMLATAGRLNLKQHGKSVITPVDKELIGLLYKPEQWEVTPDLAEHDRRSIYLIAKRNLRLPFMEAFDAPALQSSCPRRQSSTHSAQALELLNGDLANEMAVSFATRLQTECNGSHDQIVTRAYELAIGRRPTRRERQLSLQFLETQPLSEFALAIFNLNGFVYVD
jgi:hypothetical protein